MKSILIAIPHLATKDAVGNDIMLMSKQLAALGYDCHILARSVDQGLKAPTLNLETARSILEDPNAVLIYHHCVYWEQLEQLLDIARCKVVVRYHNVTPPSFYKPYDLISFQATELGIQQLQILLKHPKINKFIAASEYNANELISWGVPPEKVVAIAPFFLLEQFQNASVCPKLENRLSNKTTNILFVGRVVPNKGHHHLFRTLRSYLELFGHDVAMWIVGSRSPRLHKYFHHLEHLANELQLGQNLNFYSNASLNELFTFYTKCQTFMVLSEHEGFCVPIIEAQSMGLPIIGVDRTAVGSTIGSNQLCYDDYDYDLLASAVYYLQNNHESRNFIIKSGYNNALQYSPQVLTKTLSRVIDAI